MLRFVTQALQDPKLSHSSSSYFQCTAACIVQTDLNAVLICVKFSVHPLFLSFLKIVSANLLIS
jgi:hypothetical protein